MRKNIYDEPCACQDTTVLALDRTSVSRMVAASSMVFFFVFITGYFWGKKHAAEAFTTAVTQEAITDRMQMAFASIDSNISDLEVATVSDNVSPLPSEIETVGNEENILKREPAPEGKTYYAQLVGFGAARNAKRFVQKLADRGITQINMTSRTSRMRNGKKRTWYQVVTAPFDDHAQLVSLVDRIKEVEKLHDVRIVAQNI